MNENKTNIESLESIILAVVMTIFILFSIYFFGILLFIVPAAFIIYGIRSDLKSALLSLLACVLTVGIILDPTVSIILFLIYGPFTAINIYLIQKRYEAIKVVAYSAAILLISILILYGVLNLRGLDMISQLEDNFSQSLILQMELLEEAGLTTYELLEERDSLRTTFETVLMILPSTSIMMIFILSCINYKLTTLGLNKVGISILNMPKFSRFRLPDNFAIGTLIMILTAFLIRWLSVSYADSIYTNIMLLIGFVLFIQGLAVVNYFLVIKLKAKRYIRVLTYIIIFLTPQVFSGISLLGGIDVIFDLRKIKRAKSK